MPRTARKKSQSNIYHIMLRGINHQQIFEDENDYSFFLQCIKECKEICDFELYAYCLMGNHVHILVKVGTESLENIVKRIGSKFVYWYNIKYGRSGHLFQDRFKSEPVETEKYYLTVLRYIHLNPIKAKICKKPEDYLYSSYTQYLGDSYIVDCDFTYKLLSREHFEDFHFEESEDKCLEIEEKVNIHYNDDQAKELIYKYTKCKSIQEFQALPPQEKSKHIKRICESGVSIRQAVRLTGVSKNIIEKYLKT